MTATAELLASLDTISHETTRMLTVLDEAGHLPARAGRREAKRRVLEIRVKAQELFEWLSEARLEDTGH